MKSAVPLVAVLMAVVSLGHLARVLFHVPVTVADTVLPMWVSWVGFVVAGALAIMLWRDPRK